MKIRVSTILQVSVLTAVLLFPPRASAFGGERVVYPISMCTYFGSTSTLGGQVPDYSDILYDEGHTLSSYHTTQFAAVICPIPRLSTSTQSNANILDDVEVYYRDNKTGTSPSDSVECDIVAIDHNLANAFGTTKTSPGGANPVTQFLDFGAIVGVFNVNHQINLFCDIPPVDAGPPALQSKLIEYIVDYP